MKLWNFHKIKNNIVRKLLTHFDPSAWSLKSKRQSSGEMTNWMPGKWAAIFLVQLIVFFAIYNNWLIFSNILIKIIYTKSYYCGRMSIEHFAPRNQIIGPHMNNDHLVKLANHKFGCLSHFVTIRAAQKNQFNTFAQPKFYKKNPKMSTLCTQEFLEA